MDLINYRHITYIYTRSFFPYIVEFVNDEEYYFLNRDYEYIGLDTKKPPHTSGTMNRVYIFNDGNPPWDTEKQKKNYKELCLKVRDITGRKTCLNPNQHIDRVLYFPSYERINSGHLEPEPDRHCFGYY